MPPPVLLLLQIYRSHTHTQTCSANSHFTGSLTSHLPGLGNLLLGGIACVHCISTVRFTSRVMGGGGGGRKGPAATIRVIKGVG